MHTQRRINDTSSTPFHEARPSPSWLCGFHVSPVSGDDGPAVAPSFWTWTALHACGSESLEVPSQDSVSLCIPDVCVRRLCVFRNPWRFPPRTLSPLPFLTAVSSVCVWFMALVFKPCFPLSACILHLVLFMLLM